MNFIKDILDLSNVEDVEDVEDDDDDDEDDDVDIHHCQCWPSLLSSVLLGCCDRSAQVSGETGELSLRSSLISIKSPAQHLTVRSASTSDIGR